MKNIQQKQDIFSDLDLSQIYTYMQKGDLPVKYAYMLPDGANAWEQLEKYSFSNYGASFNDSDLLCKNKDVYIQELNIKDNKEIVIFDFGCGEGKTVEEFLKLISKEKVVYYHAFDISQEMIQKNRKRISLLSNVYYDSTIVDFEKGDFFEKVFKAKLQYRNKNVLGLLLGNTLGNFASEERILSNLMDIFNTDDRLIVGIGRPEIQDHVYVQTLLDSYKQDKFKNVFMSTIDYFLPYARKEFEVEFDYSKNTINVFCLFLEGAQFDISGKRVSFKKGQRLRIGKSKKIDELELSQMTKNLNLRIGNMRTNNDNTYLQICLSNKKYL